jgi:hypothetical protein
MLYGDSFICLYIGDPKILVHTFVHREFFLFEIAKWMVQCPLVSFLQAKEYTKSLQYAPSPIIMVVAA